MFGVRLRWLRLVAPLLLAAGTAGLVAAPPAGAGTAQLMVEFTFDSASGGGSADETGRGHALTLAGNWSETGGISTPAVSFAKLSMGTVPSHGDLNPGSNEFAVTTVFKVPGDMSALPDTPNVVQKGLHYDKGQWKIQLKPRPGVVQCRLKGTIRVRTLTSPVIIDDGAWHTATCWRKGSVVGLTVDGVTTQATSNVGSIANGRAMSVGNKTMKAVTDQFVGSVDYVSVAVGFGAAELSRSNAPTP